MWCDNFLKLPSELLRLERIQILLKTLLEKKDHRLTSCAYNSLHSTYVYFYFCNFGNYNCLYADPYKCNQIPRLSHNINRSK